MLAACELPIVPSRSAGVRRSPIPSAAASAELTASAVASSPAVLERRKQKAATPARASERATSSQRCPRRGTPRFTEPPLGTGCRSFRVSTDWGADVSDSPEDLGRTAEPLSARATSAGRARSADRLGLRAGLHPALAVPEQRRDAELARAAVG